MKRKIFSLCDCLISYFLIMFCLSSIILKQFQEKILRGQSVFQVKNQAVSVPPKVLIMIVWYLPMHIQFISYPMFISYHINRGVLGPLVHNTTYNMAATGKTQNELWNDFRFSANNKEWCFKITPPTRKDDKTEF